MDLFAQSSTTTLTDVLVVPLVCFLLGIGIWYGGLHFESRTEKAWVKWLALVPLIIGVAIGIQMAGQATDYAFQRLVSRRVLFGHWVALAMPISAILAIIGWHLYLKKSGSYERL